MHSLSSRFLASFWVCIFFCTIQTHALAENPSTDPKQEGIQQEKMMVIASSIETQAMATKKLRRYLSGQKSVWPNNTPVTIVLYPKSSPELQWLCANIIKFPPRIYRRFVMRKAFRNGVNILEVATQEEAVAILKNTPGAIAPLYSDLLSESILEVKRK